MVMITSRKAHLKKYENKLVRTNDEQQTKQESKLTYIPHHVEARMQQSKTIANMEKHDQEEPTKTIATKTIANMTGSQSPMGQHTRKIKNEK